MARWDSYNEKDHGVESPATSAEAIMPHATDPLPDWTRGIYVGTSGNVVVRLVDDDDDTTFVGVPAGMILPVRVSHVRATSTAQNMVALY